MSTQSWQEEAKGRQKGQDKAGVCHSWDSGEEVPCSLSRGPAPTPRLSSGQVPHTAPDRSWVHPPGALRASRYKASQIETSKADAKQRL